MRLKTSFGELDLTIEVVTPQVAERWLDGRPRNRTIRAGTVFRLSSDVGNWILTHQAIALNKDDKVIDGQHRLQMVIKTGVSLEFLVVRFLDEDHARKAMLVMDRHQARRTGEMLEIVGDVSDRGKDRVAVASAILLALNGADRKMISDSEIRSKAIETVDAYDAIRAVVPAKVPGLHIAPFVFVHEGWPEETQAIAGRVLGPPSEPLRGTELIMRDACKEFDSKAGSTERAKHFAFICMGIDLVMRKDVDRKRRWVIDDCYSVPRKIQLRIAENAT